MSERKDVTEPKQKNIAQLLIKLATIQAQTKLVKAALFRNRQKDAIKKRMNEFKEYAEGEAEKYSQNIEDANKAIEEYKNAVEEAMNEYEKCYLETMEEQDSWQQMDIDTVCEMKEISSKIKETMKTPEYMEWKQNVKAKEKEIKQNAGDPEKLTALAEELKTLQSQDPTAKDRKNLESKEEMKKELTEIINEYDIRLEELASKRDEKLNDLLENKETSLAKIQKQSLWQKIVARFTPKAKNFKHNVVDKIAEKAVNIKENKIEPIKEELSEKRKEYTEKSRDFSVKVGKGIVNAPQNIEKGVKRIVDYGREQKKLTIERLKNTDRNIKENLKAKIQEKSENLDLLNEGR